MKSSHKAGADFNLLGQVGFNPPCQSTATSGTSGEGLDQSVAVKHQTTHHSHRRWRNKIQITVRSIGLTHQQPNAQHPDVERSVSFSDAFWRHRLFLSVENVCSLQCRSHRLWYTTAVYASLAYSAQLDLPKITCKRNSKSVQLGTTLIYFILLTENANHGKILAFKSYLECFLIHLNLNITVYMHVCSVLYVSMYACL